MTLPRVVMCSLWRNDVSRRLVERVEELLSKAGCYPNLAYVWVVGDSTDGTAEALELLSAEYDVDDVTVIDIGDTGIVGEDMPARLRRLSQTANAWFDHVDGADYVMIHESDIVSPITVVSQLVAHAESGRCPIAGWPTLEITPGHKVFYDTWAYRKGGQRFSHYAPYHPGYTPDAPFTVESFGTVFLMHAEDAPLIRMEHWAVLDLCRQLREQGRTLWVDPTLEVMQPYDLWQPHNTREYA